MTVSNLGAWVALIAGTLALLGVGFTIVRAIARIGVKVDRANSMLFGDPGAEVPPLTVFQKNVTAEQQRIVALIEDIRVEVKPNGGESMADAVHATRRALDQHIDDATRHGGEIKARLDTLESSRDHAHTEAIAMWRAIEATSNSTPPAP